MPPDPSPLSIVPGQSDRELASALRAEVTELLAPVCERLSRAKRDGFDVGLQLGPDATGAVRIQGLRIMKEFPA